MPTGCRSEYLEVISKVVPKICARTNSAILTVGWGCVDVGGSRRSLRVEERWEELGMWGFYSTANGRNSGVRVWLECQRANVKSDFSMRQQVAKWR